MNWKISVSKKDDMVVISVLHDVIKNDLLSILHCVEEKNRAGRIRNILFNIAQKDFHLSYSAVYEFPDLLASVNMIDGYSSAFLVHENNKSLEQLTYLVSNLKIKQFVYHLNINAGIFHSSDECINWFHSCSRTAI